MKKIIVSLMVVIIASGFLSGCASKDYSFAQEAWDTNDLSFMESTPDPNEAYKFVGYFAKRYNPYQAKYYHTGENNFNEDGIQLVVPAINRYVSFRYYILESEEDAKEFYDSETKDVSDDNKTNLKYGDESILSLTNEGNPQRYYVLDGKCVLIIWFAFYDESSEEPIKDFLEYMY